MIDTICCEKETDTSKFASITRANRPRLFDGNYDYNWNEALSEEEKISVRELGKNLEKLFVYRYLFYSDGKAIGWSWGVQKAADEIYMVNTAIEPEYRNKGIYTAFLHLLIKELSEKGFQRIYSRHKLSNNGVIIPKLKAGFVITGIEVDDRFGSVAILSYLTNPIRRKILDIRIGMQKPDEETNALIV
ncbi:MAG: GNAT family N-acetyltransferase [Bacteroidetes bacterium]|nr:GNAT family N-acetyltransferase [Bacteroidota bacterium]